MAEVFTATVTAARQLSPHVRELTLVPEDGPIGFVPGQWLSLRLPIGERPPLVRAYSLANAPTATGELVLSFDRVEDGLGSGYLWDVAPGTTLEFSGPMGNFVLPDGETPLLLIARYTGIVPFLSMLQQIAASGSPRRVHLVYSAPSDEERIYHDELLALAAQGDWLEYHSAAAEEEIPLLEEHAPTWMPCTPLVCGVREFTAPLRAFLMERFDLERRAVKVENFS